MITLVNIIANITIFILEILSAILLLALTPVYFVVRKALGKSTSGFAAKAGFFSPTKDGKPLETKENVIMFHGVSVGEVIALENLIKLARQEFPGHKIVITTGTETGQNIAHKKYGEIAEFITYFPFDTVFSVKRFFKKIRPSVVLMAETELWPAFAWMCRFNKIPLLLINGRISDDSFKTYKYFGWFFRHIFSCYTGIYTQSEEDKTKMVKMGANPEKTEVMKNLKFDIVKNPTPIDFNKGKERIILAGSTHKGEDEIIISAFKNLKASLGEAEASGLKLIIAPRHLTRLENVQGLVSEAGLKYGLRSSGATFKDCDLDVILLDTMGELSRMYQMADIAFIGGSFNNTGGHNPLEAVIYSKPVVSGPSIKNFKDIYGLLTKAGAAKVVKNQAGLEEFMLNLLKDENFYNQTSKNCEEIFENQKGAKEFVIGKIKELVL